MGDLHYGDQASVEILNIGKNAQAFVLAQYVHPKKLDTFSKSFCGVPTIDKQYWGSDDNASDRPYGFTFRLPISKYNGVPKPTKSNEGYYQ